ncbi:MAG: hypothetical protein OXG25_15685 [Gammaproteobacteria bacterium]|nr:hypothetical protein [Gammaproteobacteria bacterium]
MEAGRCSGERFGAAGTICVGRYADVGGRGCGNWDLHSVVWVAGRGSPGKGAQEAVGGP